jgi:hypothetical protein
MRDVKLDQEVFSRAMIALVLLLLQATTRQARKRGPRACALTKLRPPES